MSKSWVERIPYESYINKKNRKVYRLLDNLSIITSTI